MKKALLDTLSDDFVLSDNESGEELRYLKAGHSPDILNKLKKGYWSHKNLLTFMV